MNKKKVKEEVISSEGIQTILVDGNVSNIQIVNSGTEDIKVTQYSMKKLEKSMEYKSTMQNGILTIKDNAGQVEWFFGVKANAGISYVIQVPSKKALNMDITLNTGNLDVKNSVFNRLSIAVNKSGNVGVKGVELNEDSNIYTHNGNVDVVLSEASAMNVKAKAESGNVKVDGKYVTGQKQFVIESDRGNITVK